ncbi:MAG: hypothetical protein K5705_13000 [Oscillospiraceae bacterium]|nr:hypothetical protein [Oscillospiraceae bacterium]
MEARLEYCGNYLEIIDFHHSVDDEKSGNPYNCLFAIKVKSGAFSGIADGCEYDYKELQNFIKALEEMISFKRKDITFVEIGYGNKIEFNCDRTGHIKVSGDIRGDAGSHILKFEFMTDQTVYPRFINELKSL